MNTNTFAHSEPPMPSLDIACFTKDRLDLLLVPFDWTFDGRDPHQRQAIVEEIQVRASAAGLQGTVIPIWATDSGIGYLAPPEYRSTLDSLSIDEVLGNLNFTLTWNP